MPTRAGDADPRASTCRAGLASASISPCAAPCQHLAGGTPAAAAGTRRRRRAAIVAPRGSKPSAAHRPARARGRRSCGRRESLTGLKPSRSTNSTVARCAAHRRAAEPPSEPPSKEQARGRLVRPSIGGARRHTGTCAQPWRLLGVAQHLQHGGQRRHTATFRVGRQCGRLGQAETAESESTPGGHNAEPGARTVRARLRFRGVGNRLKEPMQPRASTVMPGAVEQAAGPRQPEQAGQREHHEAGRRPPAAEVPATLPGSQWRRATAVAVASEPASASAGQPAPASRPRRPAPGCPWRKCMGATTGGGQQHCADGAGTSIDRCRGERGLMDTARRPRPQQAGGDHEAGGGTFRELVHRSRGRGWPLGRHLPGCRHPIRCA